MSHHSQRLLCLPHGSCTPLASRAAGMRGSLGWDLRQVGGHSHLALHCPKVRTWPVRVLNQWMGSLGFLRGHTVVVCASCSCLSIPQGAPLGVACVPQDPLQLTACLLWAWHQLPLAVKNCPKVKDLLVLGLLQRALTSQRSKLSGNVFGMAFWEGSMAMDIHLSAQRTLL